MSPLRFRRMVLDLCLNCGCMWLDVGELHQLSEGRFEAAPDSRELTPDELEFLGKLEDALLRK